MLLMLSAPNTMSVYIQDPVIPQPVAQMPLLSAVGVDHGAPSTRPLAELLLCLTSGFIHERLTIHQEHADSAQDQCSPGTAKTESWAITGHTETFGSDPQPRSITDI